MNFDFWIVSFANQIGRLAPWIDKTVIFFAQYLSYILAALFLVFVFKKENTTPPPAYAEASAGRQSSSQLRGGRIRLLVEGAIAVFLSRAVFVELIRLFVHRPRPFIADSAIVSLLQETSYSFPSGHMAFFFALSTTVYIYNKRWGVWFFVASAIIGLARVMAGVHYLTDILGGAVLGVVVGYFVHRLFVRKRTSSGQP